MFDLTNLFDFFFISVKQRLDLQPSINPQSIIQYVVNPSLVNQPFVSQPLVNQPTITNNGRIINQTSVNQHVNANFFVLNRQISMGLGGNPTTLSSG